MMASTIRSMPRAATPESGKQLRRSIIFAGLLAIALVGMTACELIFYFH